ncbi:hypothetical protein CRYUN_Cryun02cG0196500 [Craigia yunnanensis]
MEIKNRRGLIFVCCVFLLALLAGGENLPQNKKGNCSYTVTIQTTCTKGADTSGHVSLRFGDTKSNDIIVQHLNPKHLSGNDDWRPSFAQVEALEESHLISAQDISILEVICLGMFGTVLICVLKRSFLLGSGTRGRFLRRNQQQKQ